MALCLGMWCSLHHAWGAAGDIAPFVESVEQSEQGMTLWELIKTGGFIMFLLGALSLAAVASIAYNFIVLKPDVLVPDEFAYDALQKLAGGKHRLVEELCKAHSNAISRVMLDGMRQGKKGSMFFTREAVENSARKEIVRLWQNIGYLSDIAVIAPMVGLLGTVLGMIQAFNVIAFQTAVVKPILLAGGVSKAMVTTAGGLIVAIPAMIFYSFFRGKVQAASHKIETYVTEIIRIIDEV